MTEMTEQLESFFDATASGINVRPDLDAVIAEAEHAEPVGGPRSSMRTRLLVAAATIVVIAGGAALLGQRDSQQVDTIGITSGDLPGRIIARCLHNMPVPVGDELSYTIAVEMCAMTPEGEILGRLPNRATPVERNRLDISPDGRQLVYRLLPQTQGQDTAVVVDLATGDVSSRWDMTANGYLSDVTWSADGGSLIFVDQQDVTVQPIDGGEPTRYRAADQPVDFQLSPARMSPDGNWIAVSAEQSLVLLNTTTGDRRVIEDFDMWSFDWSSNNELAGVRRVIDTMQESSSPDSTGEVVVIDPTTFEVATMLEIEDGTSQPVWSPDGNVLFVTDLETGWFIDPSASPDDRVIRMVTNDTILINPGWAPDGFGVVAQTAIRDNGGPMVSTLVIIHATTGEISTVEHDPTAAGSLGIAQASWVPGEWTWDGLATTWPAQDPPYEPDE